MRSCGRMPAALAALWAGCAAQGGPLLPAPGGAASSLPTYENILPSCDFPGACAGQGPTRLCGGSTEVSGTAWAPFTDAGARGALSLLVDTSACGLVNTPVYLASIAEDERSAAERADGDPTARLDLRVAQLSRSAVSFRLVVAHPRLRGRDLNASELLGTARA